MKKILIIEDDPPYRKIYTKIFETSGGYTVEVAVNGIEGLEKMRTFHPDIVFVDLMMPQMDGFQVLAAVRADPALKSTPMVVLTNLSANDSVQKAMEKGAIAVIVKSDVEPNVIVEKANEVLGKQ